MGNSIKLYIDDSSTIVLFEYFHTNYPSNLGYLW